MINRYRFTIAPRDVDFSRKATPVSICDYILESAGCDADVVGYGTRQMISRSQAWVLSRLSVEMVRYPDQYESFEIGTWIESAERLYTSRSFTLTDAKGELIGRASSYWSVIDFNTRKIQDISRLTDYSKLIDPTSVGMKPLRIRPVSTTPSGCHHVAYTDIDFNGHANTARQLGWMLDTLPLALLREGFVRRFHLNFIHESRYGDLVSIDREEHENQYVFSLHHNDIHLCNASIEFQSYNL